MNQKITFQNKFGNFFSIINIHISEVVSLEKKVDHYNIDSYICSIFCTEHKEARIVERLSIQKVLRAEFNSRSIQLFSLRVNSLRKIIHPPYSSFGLNSIADWVSFLEVVWQSWRKRTLNRNGLRQFVLLNSTLLPWLQYIRCP